MTDAARPLPAAVAQQLDDQLKHREKAIIDGVLQQPDYPPLPPCPACSAVSEEIVSGQGDDWAAHVRFKPCGHLFRVIPEETR